MKYSKNYNDELSRVVDELNIVDVISSDVSLTKKGNNFLGLCPFHNEKTGSFTVSPKKKLFKCFGCGVGGNVIKYYQLKNNLSYFDSVIKLINKYNLDINLSDRLIKQKEVSDQNNKIYELNKLYFDLTCLHLLKLKKYENILNYLSSRLITTEDIEYFKIGYNDNDAFVKYISSNQEYVQNKVNDFSFKMVEENSLISKKDNGLYTDYFNDRIIFSIDDELGNLIGFSGRTLSQNKEVSKYKNSKETNIFQKRNTLYNFSRALFSIREDGVIYIAEGFFDVISIHKVGFQNVVGTMGTALTKEHINLLKKNDVSVVVLSFDNDDAGKITTRKQGAFLFEEGFVVFVVDQSAISEKDMNEYLIKNGDEKTRNLISNQIDYCTWLIINHPKEKNNTPASNESMFKRLIDYVKNYGTSKYISNYFNQLMKRIPSFDEEYVWEILMKILNKQNYIKERMFGKELLNKNNNKISPINSSYTSGEYNCLEQIIFWLFKFTSQIKFILNKEYIDEILENTKAKFYFSIIEGYWDKTYLNIDQDINHFIEYIYQEYIPDDEKIKSFLTIINSKFMHFKYGIQYNVWSVENDSQESFVKQLDYYLMLVINKKINYWMNLLKSNISEDVSINSEKLSHWLKIKEKYLINKKTST
ncbi:DNA primase [Ureaplasma canigenitalium]|uniref:DNA primase n=1 Tax=Ureaplasma canigenitalium TaxID=42092 RepID=UPI0004E0FC1F|nr:DNA primase [Ureaplasma canigenitalium]